MSTKSRFDHLNQHERDGMGPAGTAPPREPPDMPRSAAQSPWICYPSQA